MGATTAFIDAVSERVGGLLEKDFLFGSLLPLLLWGTALVAVLATAAGFRGSLDAVGRLSAGEQAVLGLVTLLGLLVGSYALTAIRPQLLRFWSGQMLRVPLLWRMLRCRQQAQLARLERPYSRIAARERLANDFRNFAQSIGADGTTQDPPHEEQHQRLLRLTSTVVAQRDPLRAARAMNRLKAAANRCRATLSHHWPEIQDQLDRWGRGDTPNEREAGVLRGVRFGDREVVAATKLGNLVEANNHYPFVRYRIEGSIFWPRLAAVLTPELAGRLRDQRVLLDFWLTLATLTLASTLVFAAIGPWLWPCLRFWAAVILSGIAVTHVGYRCAVAAMTELGDIMRAACDLGRFDLLAALHLPEPRSLAQERELWTGMWQHVLYGNVITMPYRSPAR